MGSLRGLILVSFIKRVATKCHSFFSLPISALLGFIYKRAHIRFRSRYLGERPNRSPIYRAKLSHLRPLRAFYSFAGLLSRDCRASSTYGRPEYFFSLAAVFLVCLAGGAVHRRRYAIRAATTLRGLSRIAALYRAGFIAESSRNRFGVVIAETFRHSTDLLADVL